MIKYKKSMEECKTNNYYTEPTLPERPHKYYLTSTVIGCAGIAMYLNPLTFPVSVCKELYRFEVYVRDMDEEKKKHYYNSLF